MSKDFIIGIDLGGTNLKAALLDTKFKIKHKKILSTRSFSKKEELILAIIRLASSIITQNKLKNASILGVGLGVPGPVDHEKGLVHFLPNIPGWKEVRLKGILEKKLKMPVFIDNDAKLMTLAEHALGSAKGAKNALCMTLGTGVGAGIIINGRIYRGLDNAAGEIGHLPINENGPRCNCAGTACLESYIGNASILKEAKHLFKRDISLEELSSLARKGEKKALLVWEGVARRLAVALVGAVNLLNLDVIVIGGGVANAGKILFYKVREIVKEQAMPVQAKRVRIVKAKLSQDAGLVGAAILVKNNIDK